MCHSVTHDDTDALGPLGRPRRGGAAARGGPRPGRAGLRPGRGAPHRAAGRGPAARAGARRRPARRAARPASATSTCTPTTRPGCGTPAASPRPTCCGCAPATAPTPPTWSSAPPTTTRSPPWSPGAASTGSRWCRSAAVRRSSAGSRRCATGSPGSSRSTWPGSTGWSRSTRSPGRPCSRPGCSGPRAEALLAEHGLTLGHFPQSFEYASIGGFAATRSSGQASSGYGRFDALVVGAHRGHPARHPRARQRARPPPPAPTCASWCSAPRARSA